MVAKTTRIGRTAHEMAQSQREISVSEFFVKNRHLLGFDNPLKALLTTVKEGVDNALDACEEAGILPDVTVEITLASEASAAASAGTPAAPEVLCGFTGEVRAEPNGNGSATGNGHAAPATGADTEPGLFQRTLFDDEGEVSEEEEAARAAAAASRGVTKKTSRGVTAPPERYVVAIEDNGPGIVEAQIGKIFGKLLYGSKFHRLRQSLTADQPVLVERAGRVEWLPIGSLVDSYLRDGDEVADVTGCTLRVPAFDHASGRYAWRPVSHVIRHARANEVLEVRTEGGKSVRVTGCHSLFTFDPAELRVREVEARALRLGDYIVAPKRLPAASAASHVNLIDHLPHEALAKRWIYVYGIPAETLDRLCDGAAEVHQRDAQGRSRRYRRLNGRDGRSAVVLDDSFAQYRAKGFLPGHLVKALGLEQDCADARLRTYHHGVAVETPVTWELTSTLMRFLGLYVAEGHADRRQAAFTFGAKETDLVDEVVATARVLGLSTTVERRPRNAVRVKLFGGAIDLLLQTWCGSGARQKRVPAFVFSASKELRQHFLDGLYLGDGHRVRGRDVLMLGTTSRMLTAEVETLWLMQGVVASRNGPFRHRGLGREPSISWRLDVHGADIDASHVYRAEATRAGTNRYRMFPTSRASLLAPSRFTRIQPERESFLRAAGLGTGPAGTAKSACILEAAEPELPYAMEDFAALCDERVTRHLPDHLVAMGYFQVEGEDYVATEKVECLRREIDAVLRFDASDLCLLRVVSVDEVHDGGEFVYDLSVPGFENFVAGNGAIACHNSRGQQGIGISAAGMYGQLTTGRPVRILSRISSKKKAHYMEVNLDLQRNQPEIRGAQDRDWDKPHGTRVEIELEAKYQKGQRSVDTYLRATALANPHVTIRYRDPDGQWTVFERASQQLPAEPKEVKPHPYGVELGMLLQMLKVSEHQKLGPFLENEFSRVSKKAADEICALANLNRTTWTTRVAREEAAALHAALGKVKLLNPPTDCISPIGEGLLIDSLTREYPDSFLRAVTRAPSVYRGNPFQIEVALAYGKGVTGDGQATVLRFANRVPLLYQQGACAITKAVQSVPWRNYGVEQPRGSLPLGPMVLVVHLASVWVPFTSESKEAVAHYPEILKELRLAVMDCGRSLGIHLRRAKREIDALKKRDYIAKYIPKISQALQGILEFDDGERDRTTTQLVEILNRSRNL